MSKELDMDNLTEEQIKRLGKLIDKYKRNNEDGSSNIKEVGRKSPRKKLILPDTEEQDEPPTKRSVRGRKNPRNKEQAKSGRSNRIKRPPGKKEKAGTKLARTESVSLKGVNRFEKMRERNSEKQDSIIDKALWKEREPSTRPESKFKYVEIECKVCGLWFDVNPVFIYNDPDDGLVYTCNECSTSNREDD